MPARFRAALADGVVLSAGLDPCVEVYPTADYARFEQQVLSELNPLSRHGRMMRRRFHSRSHDETLDSAGRVRIPEHLIEHAELAEGPCVVIGVADHLEIWSTDGLGRRTTPRSTRRRRRSPRSSPAAPARLRVPARRWMATLTYMRTEHVPVLAAELIDVLDPRPGETAVDCTFGGGGHARLVAERLGPDGTLVCVDRDPAAEERFEELAADARVRDAVRSRRLRRRARAASRRGPARRTSSTWTSGSPRSSSMRPSGASPTPTTRRSTCAWTRTGRCRPRASSTSGPRSGSPGVIRDYGEERHARSIAAEIVRRRPARDHRRAGRGDPGGRPARLSLRARPSREADLPGDPDRRQRRARLAGPRPSARLGACCAVGGRFAAISFHSLEDRRVKRFLADLARGCICPPELPECRCGHEPEAELITRRALAATPEEIERNPRSHSARLRAARKLTEEPGRRRRTRGDLMAVPAASAARPAAATAPARRARPRPRPHPRPRSARRPARPARAPRRARIDRLHALRCPPGSCPSRSGAPPVAVSGLAESGVVRRLTRGRLWIGALATLLVGIVALNVACSQLQRHGAQDRQADRRARSGRTRSCGASSLRRAPRTSAFRRRRPRSA